MAEGCIMGILLQQQLFVIAFKAVKYMQELISVYVVRVDFMVNLGSTNTVDCPS